MAVRVEEIRAVDWSAKVGAPGEVVESFEDIDQCLRTILTTKKGSVPHEPLFGCDAWLWIDAPVNVAVPNMIRESVESIELWEPRIEVVRVTHSSDIEQVTISVEWQPKNGGVVRRTEVTYEPA